MKVDEGARLRGALESAGRPYPNELRARAARYGVERRSAGVGLDRVAKELGVARESLRAWMAGRPFEEVQIERDAQQHVVSVIVVVDAFSGARVEGLDIEGAAELIRRLR